MRRRRNEANCRRPRRTASMAASLAADLARWATVPVRPVVAAFDVDGTLTTRDCVVPFLAGGRRTDRASPVGLARRGPRPRAGARSGATVTR